MNESKLVDTEHISGEWYFYEEPDGYYHSECSVCGVWQNEEAYLENWSVCPHCGARMR